MTSKIQQYMDTYTLESVYNALQTDGAAPLRRDHKIIGVRTISRYGRGYTTYHVWDTNQYENYMDDYNIYFDHALNIWKSDKINIDQEESDAIDRNVEQLVHLMHFFSGRLPDGLRVIEDDILSDNLDYYRSHKHVETIFNLITYDD